MRDQRQSGARWRLFSWSIFVCFAFCFVSGCTKGKTGTESNAGANSTTETERAGGDIATNGVAGGRRVGRAGGDAAASGAGGDGDFAGAGSDGDFAGAGGDTAAFDDSGKGGIGASEAEPRSGGIGADAAGEGGSAGIYDRDAAAEEAPPPNFNSGGSGIVSVSAGSDYTCTINSENRLVCWGANFGTSTAGGNGSGMPLSMFNPLSGSYAQVSTAYGSTCAIQTDGRVICWDAGWPPIGGSFIQVSTTFRRACALSGDANVRCWGNSWGPMGTTIPAAADPPAGSYMQVIAIGDGSVTLSSEGTITTWTYEDREGCETALGSGPFTQISIGSESCAINRDGSIACAAARPSGPINRFSSDPPIWKNVLGNPDGSYIQLSSGGWHNCALQSEGTVTCWGVGSYEEPPDGKEVYRSGNYSVTTIPGGPYEAVSAGNRHACAVQRDGGIACWGDNRFGQAMIPSGPYQQISPPCAIKSDGRIFCWSDVIGQSMTDDIPSGPFVQVSSARGDACALRSDGTMACWGYRFSEAPTVYPTDGLYSQVSVGGFGGCAVTTEGTIRCWESEPGSLSDVLGNVLSMPPPPQGSSFVQVNSASLGICGLKNDGTIVCAYSSNFSLEDPPAGSYKQLPVGIGTSAACAIADDGRLVCWGTSINSEGEVVPYRAPVTGRFSQVGVDRQESGCALKTDGTLVCWDYDGSAVPSPPGTYTQIDGSGSCGLDTEGNIACWKGGVYLPATL